MPIFKVTKGAEIRYVNAGSVKSAIKFVTQDDVTAEVMNAEAVYEAMKAGHAVEDAPPEPPKSPRKPKTEATDATGQG